MNYLIFLDAQTGELEKILSGTKSMLLKEIDPAQATSQPVHPGDNLYFLRGKEDCYVRVEATVLRVFFLNSHVDDDLTHHLKEMQPKLQLTESQYNYWSTTGQILAVEFCSARKIDRVQVALHKLPDRMDWIAFSEFNLITE